MRVLKHPRETFYVFALPRWTVISPLNAVVVRGTVTVHVVVKELLNTTVTSRRSLRDVGVGVDVAKDSAVWLNEVTPVLRRKATLRVGTHVSKAVHPHGFVILRRKYLAVFRRH